MSVRAKWVCNKKTEVAHKSSYGKQAWQIEFGVVYEGTAEDSLPATQENRIFGDATPSGTITMFICNPEAAKQFTAGECYYSDFSPAGPVLYFDKGVMPDWKKKELNLPE